MLSVGLRSIREVLGSVANRGGGGAAGTNWALPHPWKANILHVQGFRPSVSMLVSLAFIGRLAVLG